MLVREQAPLSSLTTCGVGGKAQYVIDVATLAELEQALLFARQRALPWCVLGGGSNVLAKDEGFAGVIIRVKFMQCTVTGEEAHVGAGVVWDVFVQDVAEKELWGVENLAGIPGTVGAVPIQNIGAYGVEAKDTISFVEVFSSTEERVQRLSRDECRFAYRDSYLKHHPELIVLSVGFTLSKTPAPKLSYTDIARAQEGGAVLTTPHDIGETVRAIRAQKFPDLTQWGTAGSFFKNPVISQEDFEILRQRYPDIPSYEADGGVKIPLAFILDKALHLKGFRVGSARLFEAQPLVVVVDAGGSAHDVELLAQEVEKKVKEKTGITIEREVQTLSAR